MGLRFLLNQEPDMEVVGEAADGESACLMVRETKPDIVLTEPPPPAGVGLHPAHISLPPSPIFGVIILAAHRSSADAFLMFKHGARGYLLKHASGHEIVEGIRHVAAGGAALDSLVAADVLAELRRLWKQPAVTPPVHLSEREIQILTLVAQGHSNREIGLRLNLAEKTIRNALRDLFQKHNFTSRSQAAVFAVQVGLLD
jgi:DNA-binding NarL/FixJ family response regulator